MSLNQGFKNPNASSQLCARMWSVYLTKNYIPANAIAITLIGKFSLLYSDAVDSTSFGDRFALFYKRFAKVRASHITLA